MKKIIHSKEEDCFLQSKDEYKAYLNAGKLKPSTIGIMEGVKVSLYDDPENYYPLIIPVKKRASNRKALPDNVSNSCRAIMQECNKVKPENGNHSVQHPSYKMDYRDYSSFSTIIDFKHPYRKILMAIKTKPFLLRNIREQFVTEGITLPPNLVVIGTVNIDETTHTFSNKVLDRAMTIEMNDIDMYSGLESKTSHWDYPDEPIRPSHLLSSQITGHEAYADRPDIGNKVIPELQKINHILCDSKFRFGYRVRDEILLYCKHNADLIAENNDRYEWLYSCLDEAIFMKIIPRIFGSTSNCGNVLKELVDYTRNKYNQTNERLCRMLGRLESSGYTHFW